MAKMDIDRLETVDGGQNPITVPLQKVLHQLHLPYLVFDKKDCLSLGANLFMFGSEFSLTFKLLTLKFANRQINIERRAFMRPARHVNKAAVIGNDSVGH